MVKLNQSTHVGRVRLKLGGGTASGFSYGRYVAYLFYSFTEKNKDKVFSEGRYLNQELLDQGFARLI